MKEADFIPHFLGLRIFEALLRCLWSRWDAVTVTRFPSFPRLVLLEYMLRVQISETTRQLLYSTRTKITQNKTAANKPLDIRLDLEPRT